MLHSPRCRQLLQRYPDNARYHTALQRAFRLEPAAGGAWDADQLARLQALYAELQAQHPRSTAAFRIPLDFLVRSPLCMVGWEGVQPPLDGAHDRCLAHQHVDYRQSDCE